MDARPCLLLGGSMKNLKTAGWLISSAFAPGLSIPTVQAADDAPLNCAKACSGAEAGGLL